MFNALLWLQWKSSRAWIVTAAVAVMALPVVSVVREWPTDQSAMAQFLARLEAWSFFYPLLATTVGAAMASFAWRADRWSDFVYALTLPIARWRQVGYRFGAGLVWIAGVAALLWVSALLAVAVTPIPASLRSYPNAVALKFGLATMSVFTLGFAGLSLPERMKRGFVVMALALTVVQVAALLAGWDANWVVPLFEAIVGPTGPLGMLAGRWMLIDV